MSIVRTASAILVAGLFGACAPAATEDRRAGASAPPVSVIRAGCRQGECAWLKVASRDTLERLPRGELRRLTAWRGTSVHPDGDMPQRPPAGVAWEAVAASHYAFCSTERPAYAFPGGEGGLTVHFLDLFDLAGYQMASAGMYLRLCHGVATALDDDEKLRMLGYRPGTRNAQVEAADVETMTRF